MNESVISGDSGEGGLASVGQLKLARGRSYHSIEDVYQAFLNERRKRRAKVEADLGIVESDDLRADESVPDGLDGGVIKDSNSA